jgi:hypothetical protein
LSEPTPWAKIKEISGSLAQVLEDVFRNAHQAKFDWRRSAMAQGRVNRHRLRAPQPASSLR